MTNPPESAPGSASDLPQDIAWSHEFSAVSDLVATSSGLSAAVVLDRAPHLVGLDGEGGVRWQTEFAADAVLVAGGQALFAATAQQIVRIDPSRGSVMATREVEPSLGGWAKATTLAIDEDLVVVDADGVTRLGAGDLATKWHVRLALDPNDAIKQLVYEAPWIAAVSNRTVVLISDRGDVAWTRQLPAGTRPASGTPLLLAGGRLWAGLAPISTPGARLLQEWSIQDGDADTGTVVSDLEMACPAVMSDGVLVLTTQGGLAGFDVRNGVQRLWSVDVPVVFEGCAAADGQVVVASRNGTLERVAVADGRHETLFELSKTDTWVPPAPDLEPGVYSSSAGSITHVALLPRGVAFSVTWSNARASVLFRPR
jgi:hypothetical protein